MKLYYYRDPKGNFGDDLNPWLWPRVLPPGTLDEEDSSLFVGIGTILGRMLPSGPIKWVMGSGTGYSEVPPLDDRWRFICVRGPLTAKTLGLAPELAATDPAALLHRVPGLTGKPRSGAAFMPHHVSTGRFDWKALCDRMDLAYIDPHASVDDTLAVMSRAALVITESLHGAIVADSLRVPWIPVVCYDHILGFKWQDWAASVDVRYEPHALTPLRDREAGLSSPQRTTNAVKRVLRSAGIGRARFAAIPDRDSPARDVDDVARMLTGLAKSGRGQLSSDVALERALGKLDRAIETFVARSRAELATLRTATGD